MKRYKGYKESLKDKTFIDICCGLGGFRLALDSFGAQCVFSSDIDKHVAQTYEANFNDNPLSDMTTIRAQDIPSHDILCAGFPCQPFSISGKKKGFLDDRGDLINHIIRIIKHHQPQLVLLENVKNILSHDNGSTFEYIVNEINKANYNVYSKLINATDFNVAQARERVYFVCIRKDLDNLTFDFPQEEKLNVRLEDYLMPLEDVSDCIIDKEYKLNDKKIDDKEFYHKPIRIGSVNKGGQGDRIYSIKGPSITLSAQGGGTAGKTGLYYQEGVVRKLHPKECLALLGFPKNYKLVSSMSQQYKQLGNSVVVDVLQVIIKEIIDKQGVKWTK